MNQSSRYADESLNNYVQRVLKDRGLWNGDVSQPPVSKHYGPHIPIEESTRRKYEHEARYGPLKKWQGKQIQLSKGRCLGD